jgi:hypothetical protein
VASRATPAAVALTVVLPATDETTKPVATPSESVRASGWVTTS